MGSLVNYIYIVSGALFILSLKWMNSPATARRGVFAGEIGMLMAIAGTLIGHHAQLGVDAGARFSSARRWASPSPTSCP